MTSFNIYDYATQQQIDQFVPTFLYIKQHSITGKLYFGKTVLHGKKFEKYKGSGTTWTRHIQKHGKEHVIDVWYCLFTEIEPLVETAINLSKIMDIVSSDLFSNLKEEQGLTGGGCGRLVSKESREKQSKQMRGKKHSQEQNSEKRKRMTGVIRGKNSKKTEYTELICPHCGLNGRGPVMISRHFENCNVIRKNPSWMKSDSDTIENYKTWRKIVGKYVKAPAKQLTGSSNQELLDHIKDCKKFAYDAYLKMCTEKQKHYIIIVNHILGKRIDLRGMNHRNESWIEETVGNLSSLWVNYMPD